MKSLPIPVLQPPSFTPKKVTILEISDDPSRDIRYVDEHLFYCLSHTDQ